MTLPHVYIAWPRAYADRNLQQEGTHLDAYIQAIFNSSSKSRTSSEAIADGGACENL